MSASQTRLYFLLQLAAAHLKKEADRELISTAGISAAQAAVLVVVKSRTVVSQKELARELQQNESAITTMIARLGSADLIHRSRSPGDGRAWEIRLTRAGHAALRNAEKVFERVNAELDRALGSQRIGALARDLRSVARIDASR